MGVVLKWSNPSPSPCPPDGLPEDHQHVFKFNIETLVPLPKSKGFHHVKVDDDGFGNAWTLRMMSPKNLEK